MPKSYSDEITQRGREANNGGNEGLKMESHRKISPELEGNGGEPNIDSRGHVSKETLHTPVPVTGARRTKSSHRIRRKPTRCLELVATSKPN